MAVRLNFLFSLLCLALVCARWYTSSLYDKPLHCNPSTSPHLNFHFAPCLCVHRQAAIATTWSSKPLHRYGRYTSDHHHHRSPCFSAFLTTLLLLTAGDVEENPGPVKYPCRKCTRPVRNNQQGIQCEVCYYWVHARCIMMSSSEYDQLSTSDEAWCCPDCWKEALPYNNVSSLSLSQSAHSISLDSSAPDLSGPTTTTSQLNTSNFNYFSVFFYANCRSVLPKLDILRVEAEAQRFSIIALYRNLA